MKVLGTIKGQEIVLDQTDGLRALTLVKTLPAASNEDIRMVQLEEDDQGYRRGDILVSDGQTWTRIEPPKGTVGSITELRCPRVKCDVQLRWKDPVNTEKYTWKHTLILRKCGSMPMGIHDGVVVTDSYVRDQWYNTAFHDHVPDGTEDLWVYRVFTFSDDEVEHSDYIQDVFRPIELSWKNLPNIVRDGLAHKVFSVGDAVVVKGIDPNQEIFQTLQFVVAGFDLATLVDLSLKHSITFMLDGTLGYASIWDKPWPEYVLTTDTFVTSRTKTYYTKSQTGEYIPVTGLPLGSKIPPNTYYERVRKDDQDNPPRLTNGGNRWAQSKLREWLNSTNESNLWEMWKKKADDSYEKFEEIKPLLTQLPEDVRNAITPTRVTTALAAVDGLDCEITQDKIFLFSATEVFNESSVRIWYTPTSDKSPSDKKTYFVLDSGVYRPATDDDFTEAHEFDYKRWGTYYEQNKTINAEGKFIEYFNDRTFSPKIVPDPEGRDCSWWLRSCNIKDECKVQFTNERGERNSDGDNSYNPPLGESAGKIHHVVFGFNVA